MFDVREFMADKACEPFPFTDMEGNTWELPHIGLMTADDAAALMAGDYSPIEAHAGAEALAAINATPAMALKPLLLEWLNHSGFEVDADGNPTGKLLAPSPSSRPTARPSRPTSRSGASRSRKR